MTEKYRMQHGRVSCPKKIRKKLGTGAVILIVFLGLVILGALVGFVLFDSLYGRMDNTPKDGVTVTPSAEKWEQLLADESMGGSDESSLSQEQQKEIEKQLEENAKSMDSTTERKEHVFSVLLLGNDSREDDLSSRTDVMLLVSINKDTKQIVLTSFMRDLYVYIPGYGSGRLNSAHVLGGPELTVDAIEQNFDVSIDAYAEVNFACFTRIVDAFGGVDLALTDKEITELSYKFYLTESETVPGAYHLNGDETLAYCRIRRIDSDFGRTNRQRKVISELWNQAKAAPFSSLSVLMDEVLPDVTTNLSKTECMSLLVQFVHFKQYMLKNVQIPADGTYSAETISGSAVLIPDMENNIQIVHDAIYTDFAG